MESTIFKKIMVATDGSELVKRAVHTAIEIAKLSEAKLYALYVIEPEASNSKDHPRAGGWDATTYIENAGRAANVEVESVILEGNPANEILNFAEQNNIDLIVMGTQGRNAIQRFLIGSVAENVVRHSERAVLIVIGKIINKEK